MSTYSWALRVALAANIGIAMYASESCRAQSSGHIDRLQIINKISLQKIDGPYSYKHPTDVIALVGYVTEVKGSDAVFRDCSGNTRTVKFTELVRIQRNCAPQSPVGPWVLNKDGKIATLIDYPNDMKVYLGMEKTQIDPNDLPKEYQLLVNASKPGDWVALSFPSDTGKLNLSFIRKPGPP